MKKHLATLGAAGAVILSAGSAFAVTMDFTAVSTAVTAELTPAITAALPIAGTILAAGIAWKLYKRFTR